MRADRVAAILGAESVTIPGVSGTFTRSAPMGIG